MTRRKLTVTGEGWKIKEKYKDGLAGQSIIESNKKDEDDFILIDGIRYKKEIANKNSKIQLEGLPFQVGKKFKKIILKLNTTHTLAIPSTNKFSLQL